METQTCPQCQIGHLHAHTMTYLRTYRGMVVSMPDTPVQVCDVCGFQQPDRTALARLDQLLEDPPAHGTRRSKRPAQGLKP